jgi:hypothetical protein
MDSLRETLANYEKSGNKLDLYLALSLIVQLLLIHHKE